MQIWGWTCFFKLDPNCYTIHGRIRCLNSHRLGPKYCTIHGRLRSLNGHQLGLKFCTIHGGICCLNGHKLVWQKISKLFQKTPCEKNAVFEPSRSSPIFLFCRKNFRKHFKRRLFLTILNTFNCEIYVHFKFYKLCLHSKRKKFQKMNSVSKFVVLPVSCSGQTGQTKKLCLSLL